MYLNERKELGKKKENRRKGSAMEHCAGGGNVVRREENEKTDRRGKDGCNISGLLGLLGLPPWRILR